MSVILRGKKTLLQRALAILRRPDITAHAYIPGASGVSVSGLPTNNYLLSDGSTGFSSTDSVVGLALDGMGTVGPDILNGTGSFDSATGWTAPGGASITGGKVVCTAANGYLYRTGATVVANKMYRVTINVSAYTSGNVRGYVNATAVFAGTVAAAGTSIGYSLAASASGEVGLSLTSFTGSIESVTIEITGIPISQETTANKPILRRGAVNFLLQSETFSGWNTTTMSPTAGATDPLGGTTAYTITAIGANSDIFKSSSLVGSCVNSIWIRRRTGTGTVSIVGANFANWHAKAITGEWVRYSDTRTCSGLSGAGVQIAVSGDAVDIWHPQLEYGTTPSAYSPTTTAAASNPNAGSYSWSFDGSNDSLALGSVPFQMSDDHCVIAGVKQLVAANGYVFSQNNTAATTLVGAVAVTSGGFARALWSDDGGATAYLTGTAPILGTSTVVTAVKQGNAKRLRVNGVQDGATNNTAMGATTLNTASIGSYTTAGNINAQIGPVIVIKGTVSDADILALERLVGQLMGITI